MTNALMNSTKTKNESDGHSPDVKSQVFDRSGTQKKYEGMYNEYVADHNKQKSVAKQVMALLGTIFGKKDPNLKEKDDPGYTARVAHAYTELWKLMQELFAADDKQAKE